MAAAPDPSGSQSTIKPDAKREEFRRYLEKSGVMDGLTRVLVQLYEEPNRPANAMEYFLEKLAVAVGSPAKAEAEELQHEISGLKKKIGQIQEENGELKKKLETFEGTGGLGAGGEEGAH